MPTPIISLYQQRQSVPPLEPVQEGTWRDQMRYRWVYSDLESFEFDTYPFVIHTVERIATLSRKDRQRAIAEAGYNTFLLRSADVSIDLLTDSGTSAMSTDQWAGLRRGPRHTDDLRRVSSSGRRTSGKPPVTNTSSPPNQGRAAEQILSEVMIEPGQLVPGNMYFTTTKLHQELAGGVFADVIVDEAHDPSSDFPWKGQYRYGEARSTGGRARSGEDRLHLLRALGKHGRWPARVSMDNMRDVYGYCSSHHIPVFFDATRMVGKRFHDPASG